MRVVFTEAHRVVALPVYVVQAAWPRLLRDRLDDTARLAYAHGLAYLDGVRRPPGARSDAHLVGVRTLPMWRSGRSLVTPLRWEATARDGGVFPALDANIGLTGAGSTTTVLSIVGRYEVPAERTEVPADRATVARAAQLTVSEFLKALSDQLLEMSVGAAATALACR